MPLSIVVGGDIYVKREPSAGALSAIIAILRDEDIFLANLESPLPQSAQAFRYKAGTSGSRFHMSVDALPELARCDALSIANNHVMDFGGQGYLETISVLDGAGLRHAGGGVNRAAATRPVVIERNGRSVAFLAYSCLFQNGFEATDTELGMATVAVHTSYEPPPRALDQPGMAPLVRTWCDAGVLEQLGREVAMAKSAGEVVVVSFHWGVSGGNRNVADYQYQVGRHCIDVGADIVFGHHPHVLQPVEFYRGKPIMYSLGNLLFDNSYSEPTSALVRCRHDGERVAEFGVMPLFRANASALSVPTTDEGTLTRVLQQMSLPARHLSVSGWRDGEFVLSVPSEKSMDGAAAWGD